MKRFLHGLFRKAIETRKPAPSAATRRTTLSVESLEKRELLAVAAGTLPIPLKPVGQPEHVLVYIEALPAPVNARPLVGVRPADFLVFVDVLGPSGPRIMQPLTNPSPGNVPGDSLGTMPVGTAGLPLASSAGKLIFSESVVDPYGNVFDGEVVQLSRPELPPLPPGEVYSAYLHLNGVTEAGLGSLVDSAFSSELKAGPGGKIASGALARNDSGTIFGAPVTTSFDAHGFQQDLAKWVADAATVDGSLGGIIKPPSVGSLPGSVLASIGGSIIGTIENVRDGFTHPQH